MCKYRFYDYIMAPTSPINAYWLSLGILGIKNPKAISPKSGLTIIKFTKNGIIIIKTRSANIASINL